MSDVLDAVRAKYPEYADVPDDKLAIGLGDKYPAYLDRSPAFREEYTRFKYPGESRISAPEEIVTPTGVNASAAWKAFRQSDWGHRLFGPTEPEKAAGVQTTGSPGEIAATALEHTTLPVPAREAITSAAEPILDKLTPESAAVLRGAGNVAANLPLLPLGGGAIGKAAMGAFAVQYAGSLPEAKKAYVEALQSGDAPKAIQIATETLLGGGLVALGSAHALKELAPQTAKAVEAQGVGATERATELATEPAKIQETPAVVQPPTTEVPSASSVPEATEVHGDVQPQSIEGAGEVPAQEGSPGVQPQAAERLPPSGGEPQNVESAPTKPEQALGIVPPGFAKGTELVDRLKRAWEGVRTAWRTSPNKESMSAHMDAADNTAKIAGKHMQSKVEVLVPDELDRKAITFLIEAKNAESNQLQPVATTLQQFLAKVGSKDADAANTIRHAIANEARLRPLADQVAAITDQQLAFEHAAGVNTDSVEGYIKHAYDMDVMMGKNRPVILSGTGNGSPGTAFKKQRVFESYADAIEAGYKPATLDSARLVNSRVAAGTKLVNRIQWGNALREVNDPTSNKPIVTDMVVQPKGTEVAPPGYRPNEIVPGVRVAVHEGYGPIFDALTGTSKLAELELKGIPVGQIALNTGAAIKHGLLMFDTFHASRIMQKQLFLTGKLSWAKGKTLLDYSDSDLAEAVKQDLITQEMADYAKANRPTAELLLKEGLNVGRIQEALYADVVHNVPIIGTFNKWVFDKVTRGAMLESGIIEFERVKKANPNLSDAEVARKVSRDLNFYFGNIGRQGLLKSKTFQDIARLVALAPQWVESMAQTEVRAYGQLAKAPFESAAKGQLVAGTLAKGVGQGLVAYFIGTQLLNLATRGTFTWDNPEKDHKLDAWIPDVTGNGPGFFLSPFSVVADVTHDFKRYAGREGELGAIAHIAKNKLSPLSRSASVLFSGEDYSGKKIYGTWERVKAAGWELTPIPIPASSQVKGTEYPGQVQRQLTSSLGFKTEPAHHGPERPEIVGGNVHARSLEQFEQYLNSVADDARKLPAEQRMAYTQHRILADEVSPKYRAEAQRKLKNKVRRP